MVSKGAAAMLAPQSPRVAQQGLSLSSCRMAALLPTPGRVPAIIQDINPGTPRSLAATQASPGRSCLASAPKSPSLNHRQPQTAARSLVRAGLLRPNSTPRGLQLKALLGNCQASNSKVPSVFPQANHNLGNRPSAALDVVKNKDPSPLIPRLRANGHANGGPLAAKHGMQEAVTLHASPRRLPKPTTSASNGTNLTQGPLRSDRDSGLRNLLAYSPRASNTPRLPDASVSGELRARHSGPITPEEALKLYRGSLTAYEQEEFKNYDTIYFLGQYPCAFEVNSDLNDTRCGYVSLAATHPLFCINIFASETPNSCLHRRSSQRFTGPNS
eukprot:jgi/Botrbrau1/10101/Bobra.20_2s0008.1